MLPPYSEGYRYDERDEPITGPLLRWPARIVALLNVPGAVLGWSLSPRHWVVVAFAAILLGAVLVWRWERVAGALFLAGGLALLAFFLFLRLTAPGFPHATFVFDVVTFALPPLAAGGLLLAAGAEARA